MLHFIEAYCFYLLSVFCCLVGSRFPRWRRICLAGDDAHVTGLARLWRRDRAPSAAAQRRGTSGAVAVSRGVAPRISYRRDAGGAEKGWRAAHE